MEPVLAATTSWPEAAIAIAGVLLITAVAVVIVWQGLGTVRAKITTSGDERMRELAEEIRSELRQINQRLDGMPGGGAQAPGAGDER